MKKIAFVLSAILGAVLCAIIAYAGSMGWTRSLTFTTDTQVSAYPAYIESIHVVTDGIHGASFQMYNTGNWLATSRSAVAVSAAAVGPVYVITTSETDRVQVVPFAFPLRLSAGLYIDVISGPAVSYTVNYSYESDMQ